MKLINLTKGYKTMVDDRDFNYLNQFNWHFHTNGARRTKDKVFMHHLIQGREKGFMVDHINRDNLDNRRINLRFATRAQNRVNSKIQSDNTSSYRGVTRRGSKWQAYITFEKKVINLGRFFTKEEAAKAYNEKAKIYYKEFAQLNYV